MRPLSARNPRVKALGRLVRRPGERADRRALVVEGPVLVEEAIRHGVEVREVYVDAERVDDTRIRSVLERLDPIVTERWTLPGDVLDRIGDTATSQGLLAVVERPRHTVAPDRFVLVLDHVSDPGNVGTLVRAAAAAGAGEIVVIGGVDPTSPKVVRASAGAVFSLPIRSETSLESAIADLHARGLRVVGTVPRDGVAHTEARLDDRTALVLGNEAHGLGAADVDRLDGSVTIEMDGPTESLNVAMAGTILAFEILRGRRAT